MIEHGSEIRVGLSSVGPGHHRNVESNQSTIADSIKIRDEAVIT